MLQVRRFASRVALLALASGVAATSALAPAAARADSCPGADPCPYQSVTSLSRQGGGVLRQPQAVAIDAAGNVYVADRWGYRIQKFNPDGAFLHEWGSYGTGPGEFGAIGGLAIDATGNVYALDSDRDRVQKFAPDGRFLKTWGGRGSTPGRFDIQWKGGIAASGMSVYVADSGNDRIQKFDSDGTFIAKWGNSG